MQGHSPGECGRRIAGRDACPRQKKFRSATSPPAARTSPAPFLLALPTKPKCGFAGAPARQASASTGRFCAALTRRSHGTAAGWAVHTCTQRATQGPTPRFAGWEMYGPPDPWESHKVPYNAKHGVMHLTGVGRGRFPVPAAPTAADGAPPKHLGTGRRYRAGCHFALRPLWW